MGQRQDHTAMAVIERKDEETGWDWVEWRPVRVREDVLRGLERLPLGTTYVEAARRVRELVEKVEAGGPCRLLADATGVGAPVMELLRREGLGRVLEPVVITAGDRERRSGGMSRVPKRDLIVGLQTALECGELGISGKAPWGPALMKELMGMRLRVGASGHEGYAAWREGEHDDLVLAVALACWGAKKGEVGEKGDGWLVRT